MAYIGKNLVGILKEQKTVDTMTGDGSDTTLTLSDTPGSVNNVLVFFDGIRQTPITDYTLMGTTLTFTTAPEASVNVVAISGNWSGVVPKMGSVTSSKIVDGMVMDANIATGVAASKLTGALPAISGANLTGITTSTGITSNASDPTISTNPSGGLGTVWANTTSGEMFVLTDATAGSNVWINVGTGEGDVGKPFGGMGGGTVSGYTSGGLNSANVGVNTIDKFSFTSNGNATDHGDLSVARTFVSGLSSTTHGFTMGGRPNGSPAFTNIIDKFAFSSNVTATDHGDMTAATRSRGSSADKTNGYSFGGGVGSSLSTTYVTTIDTFAYSSNVTAASHGNLNTPGRLNLGGHSSSTHGFATGGSAAPAYDNIDKFAFSSNVTATDHGNLSVVKEYHGATSSLTEGFVAGGSGNTTLVENFLYSSNSVASSHTTLSSGRTGGTGHSSTTNGYTSGGNATSNVIDKFSFSTTGIASDVGDLTQSRGYSGGHQF